MKKVLIAGGLCGTTMLRAAMDIENRCIDEGIDVRLEVQNLWETTFIEGKYDVIIEMFPYFENQACPVLSGKPYILRKGEKELVNQVVGYLKLQESLS